AARDERGPLFSSHGAARNPDADCRTVNGARPARGCLPLGLAGTMAQARRTVRQERMANVHLALGYPAVQRLVDSRSGAVGLACSRALSSNAFERLDTFAATCKLPGHGAAVLVGAISWRRYTAQFWRSVLLRVHHGRA